MRSLGAAFFVSLPPLDDTGDDSFPIMHRPVIHRRRPSPPTAVPPAPHPSRPPPRPPPPCSSSEDHSIRNSPFPPFDNQPVVSRRCLLLSLLSCFFKVISFSPSLLLIIVCHLLVSLLSLLSLRTLLHKMYSKLDLQ